MTTKPENPGSSVKGYDYVRAAQAGVRSWLLDGTMINIHIGCTCSEWKHGVYQLINAEILLYNQDTEYTGKKFKFCPWCGKELERI